MKTSSVLRNSFALACAMTTMAGSAFSWAGDEQREKGAILTERPAVRAIVEGPVMLRAYPRFSLGTLFLVDAAGGSDTDCRAGARTTPVELIANRRAEVDVPAGKVACVSVTKAGSQELLWKARRRTVAADPVVATR